MTTLDETRHEHGHPNTYAYGCRCPACRKAWCDRARSKKGSTPSQLALDVERLEAECDAYELRIDALRAENDMLRARLDELVATQ